MADIYQQISQLAQQYQAEQLAVLEKLSAIDCGSGNKTGNQQVVKLIDQQLQAIKGIEIEHFNDEKYGTAIVAHLNPSKAQETIILNAHLDTVYNPNDCAAHPFHIEGDKAYGLGIADCKGGVITAIYTLRLLQQLNSLPPYHFVLLFNPDEEVSSPFGKTIFKKYNGAKAALVFEPARESDGIIVSRKTACLYHIEVTGKAAHSGVNFLAGASAVTQLAYTIEQLSLANDAKRNIFFNPVELLGGKSGMGVVPDYASVSGSVRIGNQQEVDYVTQTLKNLEKNIVVSGTSVKAEITYVGTPMPYTDAGKDLYQKAVTAGAHFEMNLPAQSSGGGSDASFFTSLGIPSIDALGPHMYAMHSFEEALQISSLPKRLALAAAIILQL